MSVPHPPAGCAAPAGPPSLHAVGAVPRRVVTVRAHPWTSDPPMAAPFRHVLVLEYHAIVPAQCAHNAYEVPVSAFARQMAQLHASGVPVVTARTLAAWMSAGAALPPLVAVVTFDDGYEGVYRYALPVLSRYHMPFTAFVIGSAVRPSGPVYPSGLARLTVAELRAMQATGLADIESHTWNLHGNVPCPYNCASAPAIASDLAHENRFIRRTTGIAPIAFAYPGGMVSAAGLDEAKRFYQIAFIGEAVPPPAVWSSEARWLLPRFVVVAGTDVTKLVRQQRGGLAWYTTQADFLGVAPVAAVAGCRGAACRLLPLRP